MSRSMMRNSFVGKLFLLYVLLFTASMIAISSISYYYNSSNSIQQVSQTYEKLLLQADYNITSIYERAFQTGSLLLDYREIVAGLYGTSLTEKEQTAIMPPLLRAVYADKTYNSIYLYNSNTDTFLHTIARNVQVEDMDKDIMMVLEKSRQNYKNLFYPHVQSYRYNDVQYTDYLLSLVFRYSGPDDDSAIVINLGKDAIMNLFKSMQNTQYSEFMVVDQAGKIISCSYRPELFMNNAAGEPFVKEILSGIAGQGNFVSDSEGKKSLINFIYNDKLEWYIISITDYDRIVGNVRRLQQGIVLTSLAILLLGIVLTIAFTRKAYTPFHKIIEAMMAKYIPEDRTARQNDLDYINRVFNGMVNKISTLESAVAREKAEKRLHYLKELLAGEVSDKTGNVEETLKEVGVDLQTGHMTVCIIRLDRKDIMRLDSDTNLIFFKNVIFEIYAQSYESTAHGVMFDNSIDEIIFMSSMNDPKKLEELLKDLLHKAEGLLHISLIAGIGSHADTILYAAESLKNARIALDYKYLWKHQKILNYGEIIGTSKTGVYPIKLESHMLDAIKANHTAMADKAVSEICEFLRGICIDEISGILEQIAITIDKNFAGIIDFNEFEIYKKYGSLHRAIKTMEYLDDAGELLKNSAGYIIMKLKEDRTRDSNSMIRKACEYIHSHYADYEISAEQISSLLGITVPYFSKLFSETMKTTYTNYITELRLSKAKELIAGSRISITEICGRVGISNSSYFITLFKKTYGLSPNQYRKTVVEAAGLSGIEIADKD